MLFFFPVVKQNTIFLVKSQKISFFSKSCQKADNKTTCHICNSAFCVTWRAHQIQLREWKLPAKFKEAVFPFCYHMPAASSKVDGCWSGCWEEQSSPGWLQAARASFLLQWSLRLMGLWMLPSSAVLKETASAWKQAVMHLSDVMPCPRCPPLLGKVEVGSKNP